MPVEKGSTPEHYSDPKVEKLSERLYNVIDKIQDPDVVPFCGAASDEVVKRITDPLITRLNALIDNFLSMKNRILESELEKYYCDIKYGYWCIAHVFDYFRNHDGMMCWRKKALDVLNSAPASVDLNEEKFKLAVDILFNAIRLLNKEECGKYLKLSNELYNICRSTELQADADDKKFQDSQEISTIDRCYLRLLDSYHDYYKLISKNREKRVHYGIKHKKFQVQFNSCHNPAKWISEIVGFAIGCRKFGAGKQCHHLLLAAKAMFNKHQHKLKGYDDNEDNPLHNDKKFLESFIDVELANYYLWVLECPSADRSKLGGNLVNDNSFIEFEGLDIETCQETLDLQVEKMSENEIKQLLEEVENLLEKIKERDLQSDMMNYLGFKDTKSQLQRIKLSMT